MLLMREIFVQNSYRISNRVEIGQEIGLLTVVSQVGELSEEFLWRNHELVWSFASIGCSGAHVFVFELKN